VPVRAPPIWLPDWFLCLESPSHPRPSYQVHFPKTQLLDVTSAQKLLQLLFAFWGGDSTV